jgi:L-histidine N-alpha-methyltransferase
MTTVAEHRITDRFRADVLAGLTAPRKRLAAKYFYDAEGSRLFDRITELEEYYPTRTELCIMRRHAAEMAAAIGPRCLLTELGAGSLTKVRLLLDQLPDPVAYVPVDVSGDYLSAAAAELEADYPRLDVLPVVADFTTGFAVPEPARPTARRAVYFPGSTLGNFDPPDADRLLRRVARLVGPGGCLLLGVDLRKDVTVLEAAYNDRRGVTAAFNKNVLARINRELGADFDLESYRHRAFYNSRLSRIEMHLVSETDQEVRIGDAVVRFRAGESIHTENSYKYDLGELRERADGWGFRVERVWTDPRRYFAVILLAALGHTLPALR